MTKIHQFPNSRFLPERFYYLITLKSLYCHFSREPKISSVKSSQLCQDQDQDQMRGGLRLPSMPATP